MSARPVITVVLLLFVGVSVLYVATKPDKEGDASLADVSHPPPATQPAGPQATQPVATPDDRTGQVIVYYFFASPRCKTCHNIETWTRECVGRYFAPEIADGLLTWQAVDLDQPANKHYAKDYGLFSKSVVVARLVDDKCQDSKNLTRIWQLVADKTAFQRYIREEVSAALRDN